MGRPVVGIDLGTSNSVVATVLNGEAMVIPDTHGRTVFPSIVSFPEGQAPLIGHEARLMLFDAPERTIAAAKRLIGRSWLSSEVQQAAKALPFPIVQGEADVPLLAPGNQQLAIEQIQAMILGHIKSVAESYLGEAVQDAVITVPANFNESQRQATRLAGELAGFRVHRILNEPTAAALAYGNDGTDRARIAVYDFGGGTFDITLLEVRGHIYEVLATAGDTFLGGEDIDGAIARVLEEQALSAGVLGGPADALIGRRLRAVAERMKIALTDSPTAEIRVAELVPGSGQEAVFRLDRARMQQTCMAILQQTFMVCDEALSLAGIAATEIDRLLLVGGSTRSPFVRENVEQYFFRKAEAEINPDEVVALGAAIAAYTIVAPEEEEELDLDELLEEDAPVPAGGRPTSVPMPTARPGGVSSGRPAPLLIDVIPRALGVRTAGGFVDQLIPRNATVPARQVREYATSRDQQTTVRLAVYEGENRKAEENHHLGDVVLDGLRPAPRGDVVVEVEFHVGVDGLLNVAARDTETGQAQQVALTIAGAHSASAVAKMRGDSD